MKGAKSATIATDLITSSRCPVMESGAYMGKAAYFAAETERLSEASFLTVTAEEPCSKKALHSTRQSAIIGRLPSNRSSLDLIVSPLIF